MWHTAWAGGMGVRSGRWERHGPFTRVTSPRGSVPVSPVWGEGPCLLRWPVGQGVLPGLWNPAGRGMPARIVHIVGPRCTGGNPNHPTALIPTGLAPRPSLHGFCLTAEKSYWQLSQCSHWRMLTCRRRCSDWPAAGWGAATQVSGRCGAAHQHTGAPVVGARSVEQPGEGGGSGETSSEGESWARLSVRHPDPAPPPPPPSAQGCGGQTTGCTPQGPCFRS